MSNSDSIPSYDMSDSHSVDEFVKNNKLEFSKIIVSGIQRALEEDVVKMPVLKLCLHGLPFIIITVDRGKFTESLLKCLKHLEKHEEYEWCSKIMKLLNDERIK
jgi:hypothetical protein